MATKKQLEERIRNGSANTISRATDELKRRANKEPLTEDEIAEKKYREKSQLKRDIKNAMLKQKATQSGERTSIRLKNAIKEELRKRSGAYSDQGYIGTRYGKRVQAEREKGPERTPKDAFLRKGDRFEREGWNVENGTETGRIRTTDKEMREQIADNMAWQSSLQKERNKKNRK